MVTNTKAVREPVFAIAIPISAIKGNNNKRRLSLRSFNIPSPMRMIMAAA